MDALFPFTKFLPPQLDDRMSVRRVVEPLDAAVSAHSLTVVSAPAGSGKTTALAAWSAVSDAPVGWVRMSEDDDSPPVLAAALLAGIRRVAGGFGHRLEQVLAQPETATSRHHLLTSLVNDLGEVQGLRLVLDDFHAISGPECLALLGALVDHLPHDVRLVVASRTPPALSLPRRRVRGELAELGLADLRLDHESVRSVFARDAEVGDDLVEEVARATGGWAAAVRLAAAGIAAGLGSVPQAHEDPVATIRPELWRFLADEVLDAQPEDLRTFLLETAILDELTPSACARVTGRPDAAELLAELDRRNLFLARYVGSAGRVWRYHDLFATFLRDRLHAERSAPQLSDLHRRAADALPPARAVPHLLFAGEHEQVATFVVETVFRDMDASVLPMVVPWVEALPPEVVGRHHRLALTLAWRDEVHGRATEVITRLEPLHARLRTCGDSRAAAEVGLELASAHYMAGDVERVGTLLDEALEQQLDGWWRVVALALRMHRCRDRGDWSGASHDLGAAFDLALATDDAAAHRVLASTLSWRLLFADQGPAWVLARTGRLADRLRGPGGAAGLTQLRPVLAGAAFLGMRLGTAADEVRRALADSREMGVLAWTHQKAEALLLALSLAATDHATIRAVAEDAFARTDSSPVDAAMHHCYAHAALRSAWLRRDRAGLDAVLGRLAGGPWPEDRSVRVEGQTLQARLAGRRPDLEALQDAEEMQRHLRCWLAIGLPGLERATILLDQGRTATALEAAEPTLAAAARYGAGLLVPEAPSHTPLLRRCVRAGLHADVVREALSPQDRRPGSASVDVPGTGERLSRREVEVLAHVARGQSNGEIAAELFISEVTVKSHLTRVLRKLGASSRTHAVARARELHLL